MKKIISVLAFFIVLGLSAPAWSQAQLSIGIKGGLNFAKLDVNGSVASNYESRTGYHAGAFVLFKLTAFAFQPEILFSKQGSQFTANTKSYEANFDYINVPLMFKFYLPLGLNIQAGPQFGFLTTAEFKETVSGITTDQKDFYKGTDTSASMGLGWDLPFGLSVDARYNLGLSKINEGTNNSSTKNKVFQLSAGYKLFKFGGK